MKKMKKIIQHTVESVLEKDLRFTYQNQTIHLTGEFKVLDITDTSILIKHDTQLLFVKGNELNVRQLLKNEIVIEGRIKLVEFR